MGEEFASKVKTQAAICANQMNAPGSIAVTNIGCDGATVRLYDGCFGRQDSVIFAPDTRRPRDRRYHNVQQQKGGSDCEVLTTALVTSLVFA